MKLYNDYFSVFGFPQRLMSDQGTGFIRKSDPSPMQPPGD